MKRRRKPCFEQLGERQVLSANPVVGSASLADDADSGHVIQSTVIEMEGVIVEHDVVERSSDRTFAPGGKFKIDEHRSDSDEGPAYVITAIEHFANEPLSYQPVGQTDSDYHNSFSCIPKSVTYRPARITPRPVVQGAIPAVVVGTAGEEIYPDNDGVKVQFPWEPDERDDDKSSCWIRVSQVHASSDFGGSDVPVCEAAIVDLVGGDPDRPFITGRLHHVEHMPPYGLPGGINISGIKSNSTDGGVDNEYVLDDTKGNELLREHSQFDNDSMLEHDLREHVLHDRTHDVTNDETIQIGIDRTLTVGNNETNGIGNERTSNIGHNQTLTVGSDQTQTTTGKATKDMVLKGKKILQN